MFSLSKGALFNDLLIPRFFVIGFNDIEELIPSHFYTKCIYFQKSIQSTCASLQMF